MTSYSVNECPHCSEENTFTFTEDDTNNNFDFSCDFCGAVHTWEEWDANEVDYFLDT